MIKREFSKYKKSEIYIL